MRNKAAYLWGMLGKLGPQLIYMATNLVLARFLTPAEFGQIGVLTIFQSIALTIMESGLGGSLTKEKNITKLDCSTIFSFNVGVSLFLYLIIFLASPAIENYFKIPGLAWVCRSLCLVFVINSLGVISLVILVRELRFKEVMVSSLVGVGIGSVVAIVSAVWLGWGVYSLVAYHLVQNGVTVGINWMRSGWTCSFRFSFPILKKLFSFGFFTTLVNVVDSAYDNLLTTLFGKFLSISQAGYLFQAKRIESSTTGSLSGTVNVVAFPILTKLRDDREEFMEEAEKLLKMLALAVMPAMLSVALFSDWIVEILFGKEWVPSGFYLKILMWTGCMVVLESANRNFLKSLEKVKSLFVVTLTKRCIAIGLLGICILVNSDWLIYAYFLGAVIGWVANSFVYAHVQKISTLKYVVHTFLYVLFPLGFYAAGIALRDIVVDSASLWVNIVWWVVLASVYYLGILRLAGINLLSKLPLRKR